MTFRTPWALAAIAAATLAACGGGGADTTPAASVTSVKVAGDSLADSGTFGYKFTVQGSAATGTGSTAIWPERVAASYSQTLCAHYTYSSSAYTANSACTNYAVGGGLVNNYTTPTSPVSIQQQLKDMGAAGYSSGDLVLVDGGSNDLANLISAYLKISSDSGKAYTTLLGTMLDSTTVSTAASAGATGLAGVGSTYAQALATQFAATIKAYTVTLGAPRVAVLNAPRITLTPRFQTVLAAITAASGATASANAEALFTTWTQAFNTQLASSLAGDSRITVVDFYTSFVDQITNPAQYSLTNSTDAVCPVTGTDSSGLPTYALYACTETLLSATTPPSGATGGTDWWKTYVFADSFHPTPYGHQQMGQLVSRSLSAAGWL